MRGAQEKGIELVQAQDFQSVTGKGVTGEVDGRKVALGNLKLLESMGIDPGKLPQQADDLRAEGQTVMLLSIDGKPAGLLGVADPIKESTPEAIRDLHAEGIKVVVLTGAVAGRPKLLRRSWASTKCRQKSCRNRKRRWSSNFRPGPGRCYGRRWY